MNKRSRIWLGVIVAMAVPFVASLLYFVLLAQSRWAVIVFGASKVFLLLWPAAAVCLWEKQRPHLGQVKWRHHLKAVPLGVLSGMLLAVLILGCFKYTSLGDIVYQCGDAIRSKAQDMKIINHFWGFALLISVGHSLLEEYYWRWYVFGRLQQLTRPTTANIAAPVAFAAHHYVMLGIFFSAGSAVVLGTCVALGGWLWCKMYHRQKSIVGCWISHMIVDGTIFYIGYQVIYN